ncbi:hypothetical protein C8T65DRAFT_648549 [Cerioporus squamosus]|nr:hypothetical protein C8T65DRAFT_648549 [Cerioporus squamosus]
MTRRPSMCNSQPWSSEVTTCPSWVSCWRERARVMTRSTSGFLRWRIRAPCMTAARDSPRDTRSTPCTTFNLDSRTLNTVDTSTPSDTLSLSHMYISLFPTCTIACLYAVFFLPFSCSAVTSAHVLLATTL